MGRKILEPIRIKNMEIKNRLGFPPFLGNPLAYNGCWEFTMIAAKKKTRVLLSKVGLDGHDRA